MPSYTADAIRGCVLHRDPDVLVLNKPAGLAVHAAARIEDHLGLYMDALTFDAAEIPRLGHRLDRDTAGCLALGRSAAAAARLSRLFAGGWVDKSYWAVADGVPPDESGVIDLPLLKTVIPKVSWTIAPHPDGQPAVTEYRVLGTGGGRSWIAFTPRTGRTHQIRVHAAAIGCPLVGEPYYGPERRPPGNLHLLARRIGFTLERGGPRVDATAPVPAHMRDALAACGWDEGAETSAGDVGDAVHQPDHVVERPVAAG